MDDDPRVIVKWLESPEGIRWSRAAHCPLRSAKLFHLKEDGMPDDARDQVWAVGWLDREGVYHAPDRDWDWVRAPDPDPE